MNLSPRDAMAVAVLGLRARPGRAALAMLSLLLGVTTLIGVQAAGQVAQRAVVLHSDLTFGLAATFTTDLPPGPLALDAARDVRRRSLPDLGSATMAVVIETDGRLSAGSSQVALHLTAVDGDLRRIRPFRIASGRWPDDARGLAPRLVLNLPAADAVRGRAGPLVLGIGGSPERPTTIVAGVVDDGADEANAYLLLDEALRWSPDLSRTGHSRIVLHEPQPGTAKRLIVARLAAVPVHIQPLQRVDRSDQLRGEVGTTRRVFEGIAAVTLLVGLIGILNIGLATVRERAEEFALRRAVGTTRLQLAITVLTESLLVALAATVLGTVLAVVLLEPATETFFPGTAGTAEQLRFPLDAAVTGSLACCTAALLGGLLPAIRAARLPIAAVMRA